MPRVLGFFLSALVVQLPLGLTAQQPSDPGIRVIAHFDPDTDERTFAVLEPVTGREILAVQEALSRVGVDPGLRDGKLGPSTRSALERFQRDRGLRVCGCLTYETVLTLGLRPMVVQIVIGQGAPEPSAVEVIMPPGVPPGLPTTIAGDPPVGPAPMGPGASSGQGAYAPPLPPPGYRSPGIWLPVFPYHPGVLDPIYGTRPGDRPPLPGDSGGIPFGPDGPRQGFKVPVMRPGPGPRPTPRPPLRPVPPRSPPPPASTPPPPGPGQ